MEILNDTQNKIKQKICVKETVQVTPQTLTVTFSEEDMEHFRDIAKRYNEDIRPRHFGREKIEELVRVFDNEAKTMVRENIRKNMSW